MAYVKDAGLVCASFGFLNNDAEKAKASTSRCLSDAFHFYTKPVSLVLMHFCQIQFGKLDAIITDDVNLIAHTLGNTPSVGRTGIGL
jgi:hypothetical protein